MSFVPFCSIKPKSFEDDLARRSGGKTTAAISNGASIVSDVTNIINAVHDTWEKCVHENLRLGFRLISRCIRLQHQTQVVRGRSCPPLWRKDHHGHLEWREHRERCDQHHQRRPRYLGEVRIMFVRVILGRMLIVYGQHQAEVVRG